MISVHWIINIFILVCSSSYINQDQLDFVKGFYGNKFSVEESYPDQVSWRSYANVQLKVEGPERDKERIYPNDLWLAIIHTLPKNLKNIENTRNTWCNTTLQKRYSFKCIFVLVESTVREQNKYDELIHLNETYHDIYFITMPDLPEHWFTLQQKNIAAYILARELFPNYHFYSRVDDQIVVTVDLLSDFLSEHLTQPTVIGQLHQHRPYKNPQHKYYDPLAKNLRRYFLFPSGYLSLFSANIIDYIAQWKNYYSFAPSALEDPGFGHWIYKYAIETHQLIDIIKPLNWGGHMKSNSYGDFIVYHSQEGDLNQTELFQRRLNDGYMKI